MKNEILTDEQKKKLIDLCVDIWAHVGLDYYIYLGGSDTNPCEAASVAKEILGILGIKREKLRKEISKRIKEIDRG